MRGQRWKRGVGHGCWWFKKVVDDSQFLIPYFKELWYYVLFQDLHIICIHRFKKKKYIYLYWLSMLLHRQLESIKSILCQWIEFMQWTALPSWNVPRWTTIWTVRHGTWSSFESMQEDKIQAFNLINHTVDLSLHQHLHLYQCHLSIYYLKVLGPFHGSKWM